VLIYQDAKTQRSDLDCSVPLAERARGGESERGNAIIVYKAGVKHVTGIFVYCGG
jgi:hypothetical protein